MSILNGINEAFGNTQDKTQQLGIGGFKLFARVSDNVTFSKNIPDHVLEDGVVIGDHQTKQPISLQIQGNIGDVVEQGRDYPKVVPELNPIGEIRSFIPARTASQLQAIERINDQLREAVLIAERAQKIASDPYGAVFGFSNRKPIKQQFYDYMETLYFSDTLTTVSTEFKNYKNMALESLEIGTNNTTGQVEFSATFKEFRIRKLVYSPIEQFFSSPSNSVAGKVASETNQGAQNPEESPKEQSLLSAMVG